jgi:Tol biopolymer transport system component
MTLSRRWAAGALALLLAPALALARPALVPLSPGVSIPPSELSRIGWPVLSPDGSLVAFVHGYDPLGTNPLGRAQLFVQAVDGSFRVQVTRGDSLSRPEEPAFSPDGTHVVFTAEVGTPPRRELFRAPAAGGAVVRLTHRIGSDEVEPVRSPAPVNDGSVFVSVADDLLDEGLNLSQGRAVIYRVTPAGAVTRVSDPQAHPAREAVLLGASIDGSSLAYSARDPNMGGLRSFRPWLLRPGTGIVQAIGAAEGASPISGAYSLFGERLVFSSDADYIGANGGHDPQIFRADVDAAGFEQLTDAFGTGALDPTTDAQGNLVVFESSAPLLINETTGTDRIYLRETGLPLRRLSTGWQPAMAADGSRVAYMDDRDSLGTNGDGSPEVWSMRLSGQDRIQHTRYAAAEAFAPRVAENGSWVVFTSSANLDGGNPDGSAEVWIRRPDGSGLKRLTDTLSPEGCRDAAISGDGTRVVFASDAELVPGGNPDGNFEIYRIDTTGMNLLQVTDTDQGTNGLPRASADGTRIAFVSTGDLLTGGNMGQGRVAVWREATGAFTLLTPPSDRSIDALEYSLDGVRVALLSTAAMEGRNPTHALRLFLAATDGSLLRMPTVPGGLQVGGVALSPDGGRVVAANNGGQLIGLPWLGGSPDTLFSEAGVAVSLPAAGQGAQTLAFVAATTGGGFRRGDVYRYVPATGETTALLEHTQPMPTVPPSISGTGTQIAFLVTGADTLNPDGSREVFAATLSSVAVVWLAIEAVREDEDPDVVVLRWRADVDEAHATFAVQRAPRAEGPWRSVSGALEARGAEFRFVDAAPDPTEPWYRALAVDRDGRIDTSAPVLAPPAPERMRLSVRPNPSRDTTILEVERTTPGTVRLSIVSVTGRRVTVVADAVVPAGRTAFTWTGTDDAGRRVAPGIYFAVIEGGPSARIVRLR